MKKLILPILFLSFLSSCKSKKETTAAAVYAPSDVQIKMAEVRWPGTLAAELMEGNMIYTNQCTQCHKNFPVEKFSEKKWLHEIDDMAPKAKLSPEQKTKLTKYLLSMRDTKVSPVQN